MAENKADVRFVVTFNEAPYYGDSRYAHIVAHAYVMAPDEFSGNVEVHSPNSYSIKGPRAPELENLEITSQVDDHSRESYGWHVQYNDTAMDLRKAEGAVKVLRKVDKTMTRLSEEYGSPRDLATFMVRAVKALTTSQAPFLVAVPSDKDYEGTGFRSMGPDTLRWWIDEETKKWRAKHGITVSDS